VDRAARRGSSTVSGWPRSARCSRISERYENRTQFDRFPTGERTAGLRLRCGEKDERAADSRVAENVRVLLEEESAHALTSRCCAGGSTRTGSRR